MIGVVKLCAIVAMAQNNVIGANNQLLWHISEDLKHFKRVTMGKPLIMGRKTFESLPGVLPGRPHIVISRRGKSLESTANNQVMYVPTIEHAIDIASTVAMNNGQDEVFIAGGGEIYRQALPDVARLYLTIVHQDFEGDTVFPEIDWEKWNIIKKTEYEAKGSDPAYTIYVMDRT